MNLPYSIRMYWTNVWQPTVCVQQNIVENNPIQVDSSHLYLSFGIFCVQIGQSFAAQWLFKHLEEFQTRRHFPSMAAICQSSNIVLLYRLTVPQINKSENSKFLAWIHMEYFHVGIFVIPRLCPIRKYGSRNTAFFFWTVYVSVLLGVPWCLVFVKKTNIFFFADFCHNS